MNESTVTCQINLALEIIGGKWKGVIIHELLHSTLRFNALRRAVPGITQRMLSRQLRELERDGFVERTEFAEVPPRVEYSATALCHSLVPLLNALQDWSRAHQAEIENAREQFDARLAHQSTAKDADSLLAGS